jgi:dTDP-4-dehydrorhamnose 3,5-epimerase
MTTVRLIRPRRFEDDRGWFCETWNARTFAGLGLDDGYVQDNHSLSRSVGTVRGLHFQKPPCGQAKLVRCVRGAIFDVAVDIRAGSPTYGAYVSMKLTAENGDQLYIPIGFAHGFMTLSPDTEVVYKVTDFYAPQCDAGLRFDDPDIAVAWPHAAAIVSAKDRDLPPLKDFKSPFAYDGQPLTLSEV